MFQFIKNLFTTRSQAPAYEFGGMSFQDWIDYQKEHGSNNPLQSSAFFRGVDLIASSISNLPIDVLAPANNNKNKEKQPDHQVSKLLKRESIPNVSGRSFIRAMLTTTIINGNGYALITRENNKPTRLKILDSDNMTVRLTDNGDISYLYWNNGELIPLFAHEVLHCKGLSDDGYIGLPLLDIAKLSINAANNIASFTSYYFENDCRPSFWLKVPGALKPEARDALKTNIEAVHKGVRNNSKVMTLTNGVELVPFVSDNKLGELALINDNINLAIANILGLPPHKIGLPQATGYNSLESENKSFVQDCLQKWLLMFEDEVSNKLLTTLELDSGLEIKLNLKALLAPDKKTEIELLNSQVDRQLITKNEYRAILDMPPLADGDSFYIPPNTANQMFGSKPKVEPPTDNQEPPEDDDTKRQLKRLLKYNIDRLKTRINKSNKPIEHHRAIIEETLQPVFPKDYEAAADYLIEFRHLETDQQIEEIKQWS